MTTEKVICDPFTTPPRISIHAKTLGQTPLGEYRQEYAFFLELDEETLKISKVQEFVDSKFNSEFQEALGKWLAGRNVAPK